MQLSHSGRISWRIALTQVAILAGVLAFIKFYLPRVQSENHTREMAQREEKIESLFQRAVEVDNWHEVAVPIEGAIVKRHPQRLRSTLTVQEVEEALGAPDISSIDFRGGQHLTWTGARHKLVGSFNAGKLYGLTREDRATGRGVMVFESVWSWRPY